MNNVKIKIIEAASEMSYEKAGRYACEDGLPVSKATVCRLIKNTEFYIEDNNVLLDNDSKIHVQIDEKFVPIASSKNKKKLYTCTIFKGVAPKGSKRILQNRTLISSKSLNTFFKRINKSLLEKYKVKLDDEIYLSGDLATYIQNSPERIRVCKAIYVPDKFHVLRGLKTSIGVIANKYELNDDEYRNSLIDALKGIDDVDAKKIKKLLCNNPESLSYYLNYKYDGCSQECMNSHYFCPRFDKVPNVWEFDTIEKLSQIICCRENKSRIKLGWNDEFYEMPYKEIEPIDFEKEHRESINTLGFDYQIKKFFLRLENGI